MGAFMGEYASKTPARQQVAITAGRWAEVPTSTKRTKGTDVGPDLVTAPTKQKEHQKQGRTVYF